MHCLVVSLGELQCPNDGHKCQKLFLQLKFNSQCLSQYWTHRRLPLPFRKLLMFLVRNFATALTPKIIIAKETRYLCNLSPSASPRHFSVPL